METALIAFALCNRYGLTSFRWPLATKLFVAFSFLLSGLGIPTADAISFRQIPATNWVHVLAGDTESTDLVRTTTPQPPTKNLEAVSKFDITYNNFPDWAKKEVQESLDIWAANFKSSVPITVDATWERSKSEEVLGSANAGSYFSSFPGAPDPGLWYASALSECARWHRTWIEIILRSSFKSIRRHPGIYPR
jgi:hypothetical protein